MMMIVLCWFYFRCKNENVLLVWQEVGHHFVFDIKWFGGGWGRELSTELMARE